MTLKNLLLGFIVLNGLSSFSQNYSVTGVILDSLTMEPLPYASVLLIHTGNGAVSDGEGHFILKDIIGPDSLKFSFLGYDSQTRAVSEETMLRVILTPSTFMGPEVIIRPLSPEDYLKKVIRAFALNYNANTVSMLSFYKQELKEDGRILDQVEAGFYSIVNSSDTESNKHQLALFFEAEQEELKFMRKTAEKQKEKYLKKNPEEAQDFEEGELIKSTMPGPDILLGLHVSNGKLTALDSAEFKGFDYVYGTETSYMGGEVITIEYHSRGKTDGVRNSGTIFIDKESDAIVAIQEQGTYIIPIAVRPILFALGIKLENPPYRFSLKYRPRNGKWFMEQVHWDVNVRIKKRHLFSENEEARFFLAQTLLIREITESDYSNIADEDVFIPEKKMKEQVKPISGLDWSRVR